MTNRIYTKPVQIASLGASLSRVGRGETTRTRGLESLKVERSHAISMGTERNPFAVECAIGGGPLLWQRKGPQHSMERFAEFISAALSGIAHRLSLVMASFYLQDSQATVRVSPQGSFPGNERLIDAALRAERSGAAWKDTRRESCSNPAGRKAAPTCLLGHIRQNVVRYLRTGVRSRGEVSKPVSSPAAASFCSLLPPAPRSQGTHKETRKRSTR